MDNLFLKRYYTSTCMISDKINNAHSCKNLQRLEISKMKKNNFDQFSFSKKKRLYTNTSYIVCRKGSYGINCNETCGHCRKIIQWDVLNWK